LQVHSSTPQLQIIVHIVIGATSSSTQPPSFTATPLPTHTPTMVGNPMISQWANPRVVRMLVPLSQLPAHPKKWLPRFNPDNGLSVEEHTNNFMLSINLNGVTEEDTIVQLFPYTLKGVA